MMRRKVRKCPVVRCYESNKKCCVAKTNNRTEKVVTRRDDLVVGISCWDVRPKYGVHIVRLCGIN